MDRRQFAKATALIPVGIALSSGANARQFGLDKQNSHPLGEGIGSLLHAHKTEAEYNQHQPIVETEPFSGPLAFTRKVNTVKCTPFALGEVQLETGPLQEAREWNRGYMLRIENDRLLHNFRINAGLPSHAVPLGGWEAPSSQLRGHFVGHYLSASALLFASTGDIAIKRKADDLVAGIARCQSQLNANGYVSAFPEEFFDRLDHRDKVWAPFYTIHKIMAGLLDMYAQAANRQGFKVLLGLAGWVDRWTAGKSEEHMQDILNTEFGGMNEVLYNLALVSGDDKWARTGDRFTKKKFFNPLAKQQDLLKGLHVNTHIPQVIGAASRYAISSDPRFRQLAEFFWQAVVESRTYVTGGSGNTESWLTNANHLALEMGVSSHHQECCCAYNMMKLTKRLYSWTGDVRYIEYYERNFFNHRLGTIEPKTGRSSYFLSMSPGAWKTTCTEDQTFWCCTGTALEEFAKLNDTIYYHDDSGIYVNLFVGSRLQWKERGIRIRQVTDFPKSDRTVLHIEETPQTEWTFNLRMPSWAPEGCSVHINGEAVEAIGSPGSYLMIRRTWRAGDYIEMVFPMKLTAEPLSDDSSLQAFLWGPIVLAAQFPRGDIRSDLQHNQGPEIPELPPLTVSQLESKGLPIDGWIRPTSAPLIFRTSGQTQNLTFRPLNQSWERFAVYLKVT